MSEYQPRIGDHVTWIVDEECHFTCVNCNESQHTNTHALDHVGMVIEKVAPNMSIRCQDRSSGELRGCGRRNLAEDHMWLVAFLTEGSSLGATGGFFSADELRLVKRSVQ